jgi:hypothetical protein
MTRREQISEIGDRETHVRGTQDIELLLSIFHMDMIWCWPPRPQVHEPML